MHPEQSKQAFTHQVKHLQLLTLSTTQHPMAILNTIHVNAVHFHITITIIFYLELDVFTPLCQPAEVQRRALYSTRVCVCTAMVMVSGNFQHDRLRASDAGEVKVAFAASHDAGLVCGVICIKVGIQLALK